MKSVNFDLLVGEEAKLYSCNDINCFQLGTVIFEVIEDEEDGYRSSMEEVAIVSNNNSSNNFLDDVIINSPNIGYTLNSKTIDHQWLEFGTGNADDYYPFFIFNWNPMEDKLKKLIKL
jgi:hypothetical protein